LGWVGFFPTCPASPNHRAFCSRSVRHEVFKESRVDRFYLYASRGRYRKTCNTGGEGGTMETVTRQNLVEWFDTDNNLTDEEIAELNRKLDYARTAVFQEFGYYY